MHGPAQWRPSRSGPPWRQCHTLLPQQPLKTLARLTHSLDGPKQQEGACAQAKAALLGGPQQGPCHINRTPYPGYAAGTHAPKRYGEVGEGAPIWPRPLARVPAGAAQRRLAVVHYLSVCPLRVLVPIFTLCGHPSEEVTWCSSPLQQWHGVGMHSHAPGGCKCRLPGWRGCASARRQCSVEGKVIMNAPGIAGGRPDRPPRSWRARP